MKIGIGYDIHKMQKGNGFFLGGVFIKSNRKVIAHSDGDVLIHSICDSLLGAANLGDIGKHFPDSSSKYKGISSIILLQNVRDLLKKSKFKIVNIDSTIILQEPKISSYINQMKINIAKSLKIKSEQVSIKATTNEKLDSIGKNLGISAFAISLLK